MEELKTKYLKSTPRETMLQTLVIGKKFREYFPDIPHEQAPAAIISARRFVCHTANSVVCSMKTTTELSLDQLLALLVEQANGQAGFLLVNGYSNFCRIRSREGVPISVDATWREDAWSLDASEDSIPSGWMTDIQVLWADNAALRK